MSFLPTAATGMTDEIRKKILRITSDRGLSGAANNTKWNELIDTIRCRDGWTPSYRVKCLDSEISGWDTEWFYHLPFPIAYVEWIDIGLYQETRIGQLVKPRITDHSEWIIPLIESIGFEYEVSGDVARIFAYLPKSYEDFPPSA